MSQRIKIIMKTYLRKSRTITANFLVGFGWFKNWHPFYTYSNFAVGVVGLALAKETSAYSLYSLDRPVR
jgi:hypothetical protein